MVHQQRSLAEARSPGNAAMAIGLLALALLLSAATGIPAAPAGGTPSRALDPSAIVLTVGPVRITMMELKQAFRQAASADTSTLGPDSSSVRRFVDSYVSTLLAQVYVERDSLNLMTPGSYNSLEMFKESLYRDGVRDRLLPHYIKTDDEVVRQVYENMKSQLQLEVIRVPTLVEVDTIRADLARGIPFEDVARNRSRDRVTSSFGGAMGWMDALRFRPEQQKIIWSLPVGGISPTISDPSFHSIYKVLARRDGPPLKDLDTERAEIVRAISTNQLSRAAVEMHDDLMARYHYRVDPDSAEWLRAFLEKETATARRTYDPKLDKSSIRLDEPGEKPFWSEAPLKGADAHKAICFIDGDTLSAIEVIDQLVFEPTLVWPKFEVVSDIGDLCDEAFWERIQIREAIRLGVESDSEFIRKVTNRRALLSWRAYRAKVLLPKIRPSDEELLAMYNRTIDRFRLPERRRYSAVGTPTADLARRAEEMLKKGMAPTTVGREIKADSPTLTIAVSPDTGMGLVRRGDTPGLDPTIFGLAKGQVSDPVPDHGGFAVIRVDEILPARVQPLEEVRTTLENEVIARRERAAIEEIANEARPQIKVDFDREALANMDFRTSVLDERGKPRQP